VSEIETILLVELLIASGRYGITSGPMQS